MGKRTSATLFDAVPGWSGLRPYWSTILTCVIVAFCSAPVHGAFLLVPLAPFVGVWMLVNAFWMWRRPAERRPRALRIAMWLVCFGAIAGVHWNYARQARAAADAVLASVLAYRANHGAYPADMQAVGYGHASRWRTYYGLSDNVPHLVYPTTFGMFDAYEYDFDRSAWVYVPETRTQLDHRP